MKELVEYLASALVDNPAPVSVQQEGDEDSPVFHLKVGDDDLGKVIGKKGRTAKALRTLLAAVGSKQNLRVALEIVEPPRRRRGESAPEQGEPLKGDDSAGASKASVSPCTGDVVKAQAVEAQVVEAQVVEAQVEKNAAGAKTVEAQAEKNASGAEKTVEEQAEKNAPGAEQTSTAEKQKPVARRDSRRAPAESSLSLDEKVSERGHRRVSADEGAPVSSPRRRRAPAEQKALAIERVASPRASADASDAPKRPIRRRAPLIERKAPMIERVAPPVKTSDDDLS